MYVSTWKRTVNPYPPLESLLRRDPPYHTYHLPFRRHQTSFADELLVVVTCYVTKSLCFLWRGEVYYAAGMSNVVLMVTATTTVTVPSSDNTVALQHNTPSRRCGAGLLLHLHDSIAISLQLYSQALAIAFIPDLLETL